VRHGIYVNDPPTPPSVINSGANEKASHVWHATDTVTTHSIKFLLVATSICLSPSERKIRLKTKAPGSEKKSPTKRKSNRTPHYVEKSFRSGARDFYLADRHPSAYALIGAMIFSVQYWTKLVCFFACHCVIYYWWDLLFFLKKSLFMWSHRLERNHVDFAHSFPFTWLINWSCPLWSAECA